MSINFNDLPCDIKNIIFKMNRIVDTPQYNEFCCIPLECELYGDDPYEGEIEEMALWHTWNDACIQGYCDEPFGIWLYA